MRRRPFQGLGFTGYDNHPKKYVGVWIDNMTTSIMTSSGTFDAGGKTFTNDQRELSTR